MITIALGWRSSAARQTTAIVGVSVLARLFSALYLGDSVVPLPGTSDQVSYHALAVRVLGGHGFSFDAGWWPGTRAGEPTAHWSFLYVGALTAVYTITGVHPLAARIVQAVVVGVLHPLLSFRIASRLFGQRAGVVAAAIVASYGYFIYYAGALMTESFYIVALMWAVDRSLQIAGRSAPRGERRQDWLWLGLALAAAVLLRQVFLLMVPVVLAWVCWHAIEQRRQAGASIPAAVRTTLTRTALAATVIAFCVLPWTIRNYLAFHAFVPLNTNAGFALFWGNHPVHGRHFIPILPGDGSNYGALIPRDLRGLNEAQLDRALFARGLEFVSQDPSRFAKLSLDRAVEYVKFWPTAESAAVSNATRVFSFGIWLPFMLLGLTLAASRARSSAGSNDPGASLLVALSVAYAAVHVVTWTLVRYRLPVDALLLPFASFACVWVRDRLLSARAELGFA